MVTRAGCPPRGATAPRISPDGDRAAFLRGDRVMLLSLAGGEPRLLLEGGSTDALGWMSNTQLGAGTDDGNRFSWIDAGGGTPRPRRSPAVPSGDGSRSSVSSSAPTTGPRFCWTRVGCGGEHSRSAAGWTAGGCWRGLRSRWSTAATSCTSPPTVHSSPLTMTEQRLAYRPVTMLDGVRREALGEGQLDIASNGTLVYAPGLDATIGRLVTLHPGGAPQPLPMESGDFQRFDLSHDRRWVAASVQGSGSNELRIYDLQNGQHFTWLRVARSVTRSGVFPETSSFWRCVIRPAGRCFGARPVPAAGRTRSPRPSTARTASIQSTIPAIISPWPRAGADP